MFQLDLKNKKTIYEQIIDGFKSMISSGEMAAGEKLPSVRELSAALTVNPNTIQKAYRCLEDEGWIYTVTGRGAFVSEARPQADSRQLDGLSEQIGELISQLIWQGADPEELKVKLADMVDKRRGIK